MTDLEKELVEKLAKAWVGTEQNPWDLVSEEQRKSWEALCIEGYLPLIRSHTQTLVAAAYARATNLIAQVRDDYHSNDGPFDMGMRLQMLENEVCSLTPADAARELERREDALIRECNDAWIQEICAYLHIHGLDLDVVLKGVRERLASLSKPAPERCQSQFLGAFCELPKGHLGNHRGDEGEWKDYFTERLSKPSPVERRSR